MNTVVYGSAAMNDGNTRGAQVSGPMQWANAATPAGAGIGAGAVLAGARLDTAAMGEPAPRTTLPFVPPTPGSQSIATPTSESPARTTKTVSTRPPLAVACMLMAAFTMVAISSGMAFEALLELL